MSKVIAWSYSRWSTWKQCARKYKYKVIDKIPEVQGPHAARGDMIHKNAEQYVKREIPNLAPELKLFRKELTTLRKRGDVVCELPIAVTENFSGYTDWFASTAWLRLKIDAYHWTDERTLRVIDYKTGKMYPDHWMQMELYGLVGLLGGADIVETEIFYVDLGPEHNKLEKFGDFSKDRTYKKLAERWTQRIEPMFEEKQFKASPGFLCGYCSYSKKKGGPCEN